MISLQHFKTIYIYTTNHVYSVALQSTKLDTQTYEKLNTKHTLTFKTSMLQ